MKNAMLYSLLVKINYIKNDTFQTKAPGKKLLEKQINHLTRQTERRMSNDSDFSFFGKIFFKISLASI